MTPSDLPAFHFMQERGGIAIGIYKGDSPEQWAQRKKIHKARRVENLAANTYEEDSELLQSIVLVVETISKKIALRRVGREK
jgi:hypothetical protein